MTVSLCPYPWTNDYDWSSGRRGIRRISTPQRVREGQVINFRHSIYQARRWAILAVFPAALAVFGRRAAALAVRSGYWKDRRYLAKRMLYPGLDLHTRSRYRYLERWIVGGPAETLDAGSGNGAL